MDLPYPLYHNGTYRIIICMQHGFALPPGSAITHAQNKHRLNGEQLRAAKEYISAIPVGDLLQINDTFRPQEQCTPIPKLKVHPAFACNVPDCVRAEGWLALGNRTVKDHITAQHTGYANTRTHYIRKVQAQSIFDRPNQRLFIVSPVEDDSYIEVETARSEQPNQSSAVTEAIHRISRASQQAESEVLRAV